MARESTLTTVHVPNVPLLPSFGILQEKYAVPDLNTPSQTDNSDTSKCCHTGRPIFRRAGGTKDPRDVHQRFQEAIHTGDSGAYLYSDPSGNENSIEALGSEWSKELTVNDNKGDVPAEFTQ